MLKAGSLAAACRRRRGRGARLQEVLIVGVTHGTHGEHIDAASPCVVVYVDRQQPLHATAAGASCACPHLQQQPCAASFIVLCPLHEQRCEAAPD